MAEFLSANPLPGNGTFFCTQRYDCLAGTDHELGPHPFLVPGSDWEEELTRKREDFPRALGWRSHSCVFSNMLAVWLGRHGYRYVSTHDQIGAQGISPTWHNWGIWHLPIYYMDSMDFSAGRFASGPAAQVPFDRSLIRRAVEMPGLYVFDFHPIHIMLNTPTADYYLTRRERFRSGEASRDLRHSGYGTADFFQELCAEMRNRGLRSVTMGDALTRFLAGEPQPHHERQESFSASKA